MAEPLSGQTALVTGGSRGIGRAVCQALAAAGARVILHYHRQRAAAEAARAALGERAALAQADLRSTASITRLAESLADDSLDVLVNNAGIWAPTPLGATGEELLDEMIAVNLRGVFWLTQALLPKLRAGARIVNLSSTAGRVGIAGGRSLYGATKAAVDSLTKSWALELAPRGIRVNAVAPGYVETDMTAAHLADPAVRAGVIRRQPLGRLATAEDVAKVVRFLCQPDAAVVTGQSVNVSAGFVI